MLYRDGHLRLVSGDCRFDSSELVRRRTGACLRAADSRRGEAPARPADLAGMEPTFILSAELDPTSFAWLALRRHFLSVASHSRRQAVHFQPQTVVTVPLYASAIAFDFGSVPTKLRLGYLSIGSKRRGSVRRNC